MSGPVIGKIEQLTNANPLQVKFSQDNEAQIKQLLQRIVIIERHINLIEDLLLELRHFLPPDGNQSSA